MATENQISANQLNSKKSTGPRTGSGKKRSRRNALRHGLTAETLIAFVEDPAAYNALQRGINEDYRPRSKFELELVARLVSLLWRLRRAAAIESGLLALHTNANRRERNADTADELGAFCGLRPIRQNEDALEQPQVASMAMSFLRLASHDSAIFERLGRYEAALWRQTLQIILLFNSLNRTGSCRSGGYSDRHLPLNVNSRRSRRTLWPPFTPFDDHTVR